MPRLNLDHEVVFHVFILAGRQEDDEVTYNNHNNFTNAIMTRDGDYPIRTSICIMFRYLLNSGIGSGISHDYDMKMIMNDHEPCIMFI